MTEEQLMYASDEDIAFYHKCVEGLPTLAGLDGSGKGSDGIPLPYGTGPHSVRCLREIIEIVKPKFIFEVGFNMGWSAAMWLELAPEAFLLTCDISKKAETLEAARILRERYDRRFDYINRNVTFFDTQMGFINFDLAFIDGGHLLGDVITDIEYCLKHKIPFIAFDDWLPQFGEIQKAIEQFNEIEQVMVNGNIALYKNISI